MDPAAEELDTFLHAIGQIVTRGLDKRREAVRLLQEMRYGGIVITLKFHGGRFTVREFQISSFDPADRDDASG